MHCKCGHHLYAHAHSTLRHNCLICYCDGFQTGKQIKVGDAVLVPNGESDPLRANVQFIYETTQKAFVRFDKNTLPMMTVPMSALALCNDHLT